MNTEATIISNKFIWHQKDLFKGITGALLFSVSSEFFSLLLHAAAAFSLVGDELYSFSASGKVDASETHPKLDNDDDAHSLELKQSDELLGVTNGELLEGGELVASETKYSCISPVGITQTISIYLDYWVSYQSEPIKSGYE